MKVVEKVEHLLSEFLLEVYEVGEKKITKYETENNLYDSLTLLDWYVKYKKASIDQILVNDGIYLYGVVNGNFTKYMDANRAAEAGDLVMITKKETLFGVDLINHIFVVEEVERDSEFFFDHVVPKYTKTALYDSEYITLDKVL